MIISVLLNVRVRGWYAACYIPGQRILAGPQRLRPPGDNDAVDAKPSHPMKEER